MKSVSFLALLIFLQLVWASSYVAQKMALAEMSLGLVLVFRYGLASSAFLILGQLSLKEKFSLREWALIIFVGVINFSGSPYFQLKALGLTYAVDASILVAFEPLLTVLLAAIFLMEKIGTGALVTFFVATLGVIIMSGWRGNLGSLELARLVGDSFFLTSLFCEGICSTTASHLTRRHRPLRLIAWMILAGFIANVIGNLESLQIEKIAAITPAGWLTLLYLAIFCSAIGYGSWFFLLTRTTLSQLAMSLFLQPVLGGAMAYLLLHEKIDFQTVAGGCIVLSALFWWMWRRLKSPQASLFLVSSSPSQNV